MRRQLAILGNVLHVITSSEREAEEQNCAQAAGLVAFIKKYKCVAVLYMLSDVLAPIGQSLSCISKKGSRLYCCRGTCSGYKGHN